MLQVWGGCIHSSKCTEVCGELFWWERVPILAATDFTFLLRVHAFAVLRSMSLSRKNIGGLSFSRHWD